MEQTSNQSNTFITQDLANSRSMDSSVQITAEIKEDGALKVIDIKKIFSHEQLLAALFFAWDAAERGQMDLFLIKDTAKQVKADKELSGDKITLGARKSEWNSGQGRIFETFAQHELGGVVSKTDEEIVYDCKGVPVVIKLYDENEALKSFNPVFYHFETFNLPNPYELFIEKYE